MPPDYSLSSLRNNRELSPLFWQKHLTEGTVMSYEYQHFLMVGPMCLEEGRAE
jgi:hypothetical protein